MENRARVNLFGCNERKPIGQIEAHLPPKNASCAGSGSVIPFGSMIQDVF
jgi:hypothetical protein